MQGVKRTLIAERTGNSRKGRFQGAVRFFERAIRALSRTINGIGVVFLAAMMFLTGTDVTLRYIFGRPIAGAYELTELMMVVLVFWGFSYTQLEKGHVAVDLLVAQLPKKVAEIIEVVAYALSLGLFLLLSWQGVVQVQSKFASGLMTGTLPIPVWPFYSVAALGCGVMCLVLFLDLLVSLTQVARR